MQTWPITHVQTQLHCLCPKTARRSQDIWAVNSMCIGRLLAELKGLQMLQSTDWPYHHYLWCGLHRVTGQKRTSVTSQSCHQQRGWRNWRNGRLTSRTIPSLWRWPPGCIRQHRWRGSWCGCGKWERCWGHGWQESRSTTLPVITGKETNCMGCCPEGLTIHLTYLMHCTNSLWRCQATP